MNNVTTSLLVRYVQRRMMILNYEELLKLRGDKNMNSLQKLNDAVQALKEDGYKFLIHTITDRKIHGISKSTSMRTIEIRCSKDLPISDTGEEAEIRKLTAFSSGNNQSGEDLAS